RRHYQGTFAQNLGKLKENPPVESTPSAQFNIGGAKRIPHLKKILVGIIQHGLGVLRTMGWGFRVMVTLSLPLMVIMQPEALP
ncbi:MAG: hypothetical protein FWE95_08075, partial [Planctomycetaceae bacterium]|nr:hypothetical protein [Planctomycetaceae bacterium]